MFKILLNGREVLADSKKPLIAACHEHGAFVPAYCYHPGLKPVGSCRICQVEVKQGDAPARVVVACRTPVAEGMVVNTEAARAHDARRECLEFLLKNHPLDCPICDKAGECDLQDYAFAEGQGKGRSVEPRRKLEKRKSLGDVIVLDEERCILCSRCVRFFEEVTKKPQLTVADLGSRSVIATFQDRPLSGNYQGNLADICPVGALTHKKFRFQARVWNLKKARSTCGECSRGCAITVEVLRGRDVKRFRPRFDARVNKWWMCDTGRFSTDRHALPRLAGALVRGAAGLEPVEPEAAIDELADALATHASRAIVVSPFLTIEEGAAALEFGRQLGCEPIFVSPPANGLADALLHTGDPCPNRRGLTELGLAAATADECAEKARAADVVLLLGERVVELIGAERLTALGAAKRVAVVDLAAPDLACVQVALGTPSSVERAGTWINVDGVRRSIALARPPPAGVRAIGSLLAELRSKLGPGPGNAKPVEPGVAPAGATLGGH